MSGYQSYLDALKTAVASALPAKLTALSLDNFDNYTADVPRQPDLKELGFMQSVMEHGIDRWEDEILVHATLEGVEKPTEYIKPIEDTIRAIRPEVVGMQTLEAIHILPLYAGSTPEGGSASYIQFSLIYSKDIDSCD